jgi:hypothetical protein
MDTFVVRVYRSGRDAHPDANRLRGVVEEISTGLQATFHDATQLLSILCSRRRDEPEASPRRQDAAGATAMPAGDRSQGAVHPESQPFPTKGGSNDPGRRQTT